MFTKMRFFMHHKTELKLDPVHILKYKKNNLQIKKFNFRFL